MDAPSKRTPLSRLAVVTSDGALTGLVRRAFATAKYRLAFSAKPAAVEAQLSSGPVDLMVFDLGAAAEEAFEVLADLRTRERLKNIPVVAVGDAPTLDTSIRAYRLGCVDVVAKSVEPAELSRRVEWLLDELPLGSGRVSAPVGIVDFRDLLQALARTLTPDASGTHERIAIGSGRELVEALDEFAKRIRPLLVTVAEPSGAGSQATRPAAGAAQPLARPAAASAAPGALRGLRVFVVHDDPAVAHALAGQLKAAGIDVIAFAGRPKELDEAYTRPPDAVVIEEGPASQQTAIVLRVLRCDVVLGRTPVVPVPLSSRGGPTEAIDRLYAATEGRRAVLGALRSGSAGSAGSATAGDVGGATALGLLRALEQGKRVGRLTIHPASGGTYALQIDEGWVASIRWSSASGRSSSGIDALAQLLCVAEGKFGFEPHKEEIPEILPARTDDLLLDAARLLRRLFGALGDPVSRGRGLSVVAEAWADYASLQPPPLKDFLPRALEVDPGRLAAKVRARTADVRMALVDLFERGGLRRVLSSDGPVTADVERRIGTLLQFAAGAVDEGPARTPTVASLHRTLGPPPLVRPDSPAPPAPSGSVVAAGARGTSGILDLTDLAEEVTAERRSRPSGSAGSAAASRPSLVVVDPVVLPTGGLGSTWRRVGAAAVVARMRHAIESVGDIPQARPVRDWLARPSTRRMLGAGAGAAAGLGILVLLIGALSGSRSGVPSAAPTVRARPVSRAAPPRERSVVAAAPVAPERASPVAPPPPIVAAPAPPTAARAAPASPAPASAARAAVAPSAPAPTLVASTPRTPSVPPRVVPAPSASVAARRAPAERDGEDAPAGPRVLLTRADANLRAGRLPVAEELYQQVLTTQPASAEAWAGLARVAAQRSQFDRAAALYARAIRANSRSAALQNELGRVYQREGRANDAAEAYRRALAIRPGDVEATRALRALGRAP